MTLDGNALLYLLPGNRQCICVTMNTFVLLLLHLLFIINREGCVHEETTFCYIVYFNNNKHDFSMYWYTPIRLTGIL
jgi:hypothetical protein